ncbi:MAG: TonB-dependent receptor [Flavobacteriales bacterium]|nr:TonB-dependent receptor [Flavobacteriales bacterium]
MISKHILTVFLTLLASISIAQNSFNALVLDSATHDTLIGAAIAIKGTSNGGSTDAGGNVSITDIPNGKQIILVSYLGYNTKEINFTFPIEEDLLYIIQLVADGSELEEVLIEATRANKSVADLPTRTEVLTEEIDEAASMEAGRISHLITHSTGIQVQTTSASSNGAVVRIQGLNGRYTQMLKDGFPLYGGFSGSLDVLQIPPLDLKQVEYIKGSASTLYGGGAIGGLINLVTKKADKDETLLHINVSHIGGKDFNAFSSKRFGKWGFTNLATLHTQSAYDPDNDGFSDVPQVSKFNFNPKLFYYPDNKTELYFGATITKEDRMGGSMNLIKNQYADTVDFYFDKQKSSRLTFQSSVKRELSEFTSVTLKNSASSFNRLIKIRENVLGESSQFGGIQTNTFSEVNLNVNKEKHNLSIGLNTYTESFSEEQFDTTIQVRDQHYLTYGVFVNHLWDIHKKFALETGLRTDYVQAQTDYTENNGETFVLPRMSALYKLNKHYSLRLGGGMGYRMPTIFNEEAEPLGYNRINAVNFNELKAERSYGGNFDVKYRSTFGKENVLFTFNQMFFYNLIDNPILLAPNGLGDYFYTDVFANELISQGFESQIKLTVHKFTWFFGYTYTDAFLQGNDETSSLTLTPQHSIKGDLLFVIDGVWRIGWDYEYKSEQILTSGLESRALFTTGIVVERTIKNFVIFLNAENFTDTRQTRYESLVSGPYNTPQYTDVWAPLDGFFFNGGLKIKL